MLFLEIILCVIVALILYNYGILILSHILLSITDFAKASDDPRKFRWWDFGYLRRTVGPDWACFERACGQEMQSPGANEVFRLWMHGQVVDYLTEHPEDVNPVSCDKDCVAANAEPRFKAWLNLKFPPAQK